MEPNKIYVGDAWELAKKLPCGSIDMIMTSPPYWQLRNYKDPGSRDTGRYSKGAFGHEKTPEEFINKLAQLFELLQYKLKRDGNVWVNLNDTTVNGCWQLIPPRFAWEMQKRGWVIRDFAIWYKPNKMPHPTTKKFINAWEYMFRFCRHKDAYFDIEKVLEPLKNPKQYVKLSKKAKKANQPTSYAHGEINWGIDAANSLVQGKDLDLNKFYKGKNPHDVWAIKSACLDDNRIDHPAKYPVELCYRPILSSCPKGGVVLDPFGGTGTTAVAAKELGMQWMLFEISKKWAMDSLQRIKETSFGKKKDMKYDTTKFKQVQKSIFNFGEDEE